MEYNEQFVSFFFRRLTDTLLKYRKDFVKTAISAVGDLVSIVAEENVEIRVEVSFIFQSRMK